MWKVKKIWSRKLKVPQREVMAGKSAMAKNAEENQSDSVAMTLGFLDWLTNRREFDLNYRKF